MTHPEPAVASNVTLTFTVSAWRLDLWSRLYRLQQLYISPGPQNTCIDIRSNLRPATSSPTTVLDAVYSTRLSEVRKATWRSKMVEPMTSIVIGRWLPRTEIGNRDSVTESRGFLERLRKPSTFLDTVYSTLDWSSCNLHFLVRWRGREMAQRALRRLACLYVQLIRITGAH